jgi:hypothetical protein
MLCAVLCRAVWQVCMYDESSSRWIVADQGIEIVYHTVLGILCVLTSLTLLSTVLCCAVLCHAVLCCASGVFVC